MKYLLFSALSIVLATSCPETNRTAASVQSPGGDVRVEFGIDGSGRPYYRGYYHDKLVVDTSFLGFMLKHAPDLREGFQIVDSRTRTFDETWEQPWGEEHFIRNHYNELKLSLQETTELKRTLDIVFRAYDYGIGFRYEFPEQEHMKNIEIADELTQFTMTGDHTTWSIPAFEPNRYEYLYRETPLSEIGKVHTPVTFKTSDNIYISLHEAALKEYSSMVIDATHGRQLLCELVPYSKTETSKAFVTAPCTTPWRTIQLADKPGDLITSYLILNLNDPNELGDVSWVKPAKYIGIWWEMHIGAGTWTAGPHHSANTANTKKYIDFAAKNGFDGVLVEGWNTGWDSEWASNGSEFNFTQPYPDYDLDWLSEYAKEKGVYLIGHHETGGNIDNYEQQIHGAFDLLESHGMKAVKTGYVEHGNYLTNGKSHHGQAYVDHFRKVIKIAAQHHVCVVAHEPIKDTGERRTFPNMLSREGARGQEFNAWSDDGGNPPNHETILPFTRGLAGPMDFTPGVFDITIPSKPNNQVNTTLAKQLAFYVIIYSPVQMACDLPEHYARYPDAFQFIRDVPVDWETTKILDAEIGQYLITARKERNSDNWFVGAITNAESREVSIPLNFLDAGKKYTLKLYKDSAEADYRTNPESYVIGSLDVTSTDHVEATLAPGGGLAMSILAAN